MSFFIALNCFFAVAKIFSTFHAMNRKWTENDKFWPRFDNLHRDFELRSTLYIKKHCSEYPSSRSAKSGSGFAYYVLFREILTFCSVYLNFSKSGILPFLVRLCTRGKNHSFLGEAPMPKKGPKLMKNQHAPKLMKNHTGPNYQKKISIMLKAVNLLQTIANFMTPESNLANEQVQENRNLMTTRNKSIVMTQESLDSLSFLLDVDFDPFPEEEIEKKILEDILLEDDVKQEGKKQVDFDELFVNLCGNNWSPGKNSSAANDLQESFSSEPPSFDVPLQENLFENNIQESLSSEAPSFDVPLEEEVPAKEVAIPEKRSFDMMASSTPFVQKKKSAKKSEKGQISKTTSHVEKEEETEEMQKEQKSDTNTKRLRNLDGKLRKLRTPNRKDPEKVLEKVDKMINEFNNWSTYVSRSRENLAKNPSVEQTRLLWHESMNTMFNRNISSMRSLIANNVFLDLIIPEIAVFEDDLNKFRKEIGHKAAKR